MAVYLSFGLLTQYRVSADVINKLHKTEVHVQLLLEMDQGQSWVVRDEINFGS
jgi:hypothetical protein